MGSHNENLEESRSEPVAAGLAPLDELQTDEVLDSLVSEFSSLTTPYCWVITEDAVAGYDGAGRGLAIGRLYDPSGESELAPLDDFGRQNLGALNIQFRTEGDWQAA